MTGKARGELVPGGLAIIIGAVMCQSNLGKIVTVERIDDDPIFNVQISGEIHGYCRIRRDIVPAKTIWTKPEFLIPIHPEADPLDIAETMEQRA